MKSTMARIQNGAGVQLPECCSCHWQVRHPGLMAGEAELAKLKARFKSEFHKLQHMQQFVCPFCTISRWKTLNQSVKKKRLRELIELQRTYPVGQVFVHPGTHWYPPLRPPKSGLWTPDAPEKSQDSLEPKVEHLSREEPSSTPLRPELKLVTDWSRESPPPRNVCLDSKAPLERRVTGHVHVAGYYAAEARGDTIAVFLQFWKLWFYGGAKDRCARNCPGATAGRL